MASEEITDPGIEVQGWDDGQMFTWRKCSNGLCINSPHPEGTNHTDRTGTGWVDTPDGYRITHTNHNPWVD